MSVSAAVAGALGGVVMGWFGFPTLTVLIAILVIALVGAARRGSAAVTAPAGRA